MAAQGASDMAGYLAGEMDLPEELGDMANMAGEVGGGLNMGRKGFGSLGNELDVIEGKGQTKKKGLFGRLFKLGGKLKDIPGFSYLAGDLAADLDLHEELGEMADMAGDAGAALKIGREGFGSLGNELHIIEDEDITLPGRKTFASMGTGLDGIEGKKKKKPGFFGKLFKFGGMIKNIPGVSDLAGDLAEELDLPEELGEFAGDLADAVGEMGDEMPDIEGMRGGLKKVGKMGKMAG